MKKVISTCLFNNNPHSYRKYALGAKTNAKFVSERLPEWKFRTYYDDTAPKDIIKFLKDLPNTELIEMPRSQGRSGCFWRFLAFDDSDVAVCRDLDFPIQENDIYCIEDWLRTDYLVQCIWFVHNRLELFVKKEPRYYMAGCIAAKSLPFSVKELMEEYTDTKSIYGADEFFLTNFFVPKLLNHQNKLLIHVEPQPKNIPKGKTREFIELFPHIEEYRYLEENWKNT